MRERERERERERGGERKREREREVLGRKNGGEKYKNMARGKN